MNHTTSMSLGEIKTSADISEISKALVLAQGQFGSAGFDKENSYFSSKYATLSSIFNAVRKPLAVNGLAVIQSSFSYEKMAGVITRLIHTSGQWIEFAPLCFPAEGLGKDKRPKFDAHTIASAITYAKRISLSACLGIICDEDDDGNSLSKEGAKEDPKDPDNFINIDQIQLITHLLSEKGDYDVKKEAIFSHFNVKHFGALRQSQFLSIVARLQKGEKNGKENN